MYTKCTYDENHGERKEGMIRIINYEGSNREIKIKFETAKSLN